MCLRVRNYTVGKEDHEKYTVLIRVGVNSDGIVLNMLTRKENIQS